MRVCSLGSLSAGVPPASTEGLRGLPPARPVCLSMSGPSRVPDPKLKVEQLSPGEGFAILAVKVDQLTLAPGLLLHL